jgi:hypothetical protein
MYTSGLNQNRIHEERKTDIKGKSYSRNHYVRVNVIIIMKSNDMQTMYNRNNKDASVLYRTKAMFAYLDVECIKDQDIPAYV